MIDVYADVCCPFTHVGLRRIVEARAARGVSPDQMPLRVHAWPLELVNGAPLDPEFIDEEVHAIRAQVAPDLFTGFDPAVFPATSVPAMLLAHAAYLRSDTTGEAMSLALRDALFEQGRDIADEQVLGDLARRFGLDVPDPDPGPVLADWQQGKARGVIGSPHFFAGTTGVFCPSLHIRRVEGELVIDVDRAAIDSFLDDCLRA